jgi:hypothetical protein
MTEATVAADVTPGGAGSTPASAADVGASGRRARGNPVIGWLLVREELARARENAARFTIQQREYLRRAKLALEVGDLALVPGNAVRSGSTAPLAVDLFRQALHWTLLARNPERLQSTSKELWAATDSASFAGLGIKEAELAQLTTAMGSTFIELADGSSEMQLETAQLLRRTAMRLVLETQRPLSQLEWSKLKRLVRVVAVAAICLAAIAVGLKLLLTKPDLAKGKRWSVSSVGSECHPEISECAGATTDILFHTKLEKNPWFEYDFGAPLAFSSLTIRNRSDCCADRVAPLVVEVSNDDKTFHEIARHADEFSTWRPSFDTQHARYLRLRVARESILHLEAIQVHP